MEFSNQRLNVMLPRIESEFRRLDVIREHAAVAGFVCFGVSLPHNRHSHKNCRLDKRESAG
jgi:hypothetical protein